MKKFLIITLALLLASTSAMRVKQDDTCQVDDSSYDSHDGVVCTTHSEWCPDRDFWSEDCPGQRSSYK